MAELICRHLERLCQKDSDLRRQALVQVLEQEGLSFQIQEEDPSLQNPRGIVNYLLSSSGGEPGLLFCAHYDAVPGSFGANDNGAALCILIQLAKTFQEEGIPAGFAFFDGEEQGNTGSRLYADSCSRESHTGVINLDVCGYGDSLVICGRGHEKKPVFRSFCNKAILEKYQGHILKYLPKSDDASFSRTRIPVLSMAMVPRWDIQFLNALATYGEGLLGRPPEFDMIMDQMEISTTMHGGYRDTLEWVQPEAMEQMYGFLLEAVRAYHSQKPEKKHSLLFRFLPRQTKS